MTYFRDVYLWLSSCWLNCTPMMLKMGMKDGVGHLMVQEKNASPQREYTYLLFTSILTLLSGINKP